MSRQHTVLKVATIVSFLLTLVTNLANLRRIGHVSDHWVTPFTPSHVFMGIIWIVLYILQVGFLYHFWVVSELQPVVHYAHHFIAFNLLQFAWAMLWIHHHYVWSEVFLALNWLNLVGLYVLRGAHTYTSFRKLVVFNLATCQLPLAITNLDILHNGAYMVHCTDTPCRLLANIFIWVFLLVLPAIPTLVYNDYAFAFAQSVVVFALAVGQFFTKVIALQWIFAFTIAGTLAVLALGTATKVGALKAPPEEAEASNDERTGLLSA